MSEYIKREDAIGAILDKYVDYAGITDAIKAVPSVDVVEVVRCKDCKYSIVPESKLHTYCKFWNDEVDSIHNPYYLDVDDYNYCNHGKRKEQEHE